MHLGDDFAEPPDHVLHGLVELAEFVPPTGRAEDEAEIPGGHLPRHRHRLAQRHGDAPDEERARDDDKEDDAGSDGEGEPSR
jgi:hypothetical protein